MGNPTLWRYRRARFDDKLLAYVAEGSWQLEPIILADSAFDARAQARIILQCDRPLVEDTGEFPPPPEVIPPSVRKPARSRKRPTKKKSVKKKSASKKRRARKT